MMLQGVVSVRLSCGALFFCSIYFYYSDANLTLLLIPRDDRQRVCCASSTLSVDTGLVGVTGASL